MKRYYKPIAYDNSLSMIEKINGIIINMDTLQKQVSVSINHLNELYLEMYEETIPQEIEKYVTELIGISYEEVPQAREGVGGVTYETLKERLDSEYQQLKNAIQANTTELNTHSEQLESLENRLENKAEDSQLETIQQQATQAYDLALSNVNRIETLEKGTSELFENRVFNLEIEVEKQKTQIEGNTTTINQLSNDKANQLDMVEVQNKLTPIAETYPLMVETVSVLENEVETMQTGKANKDIVDGLNVRIENLEGTAGTKEEIETLDSRLDSLERDTTIMGNEVESVKNAVYDTGFIEVPLNDGVIQYGGTTYPKIRRFGACVNLAGAIKFTTLPNNSGTDTHVMKLPEQFRPARTMTICSPMSGGQYANWNIASDGNVTLLTYSLSNVTTNTWFPFCFNWMV